MMQPNKLIELFAHPEKEYSSEMRMSGVSLGKSLFSGPSGEAVVEEGYSPTTCSPSVSTSDVESSLISHDKNESTKSTDDVICVIDPMEIKLNRQLLRPTALDRLKKFEKASEKRKCQRLTEHAWRAMASKRRAKKTKTKVLYFLEWYLINKLAENRMSVYEAEYTKHRRNVERIKQEVAEEKKKIQDQTDEIIQRRIKEELKKQKIMFRDVFEHDIYQTAETAETEVTNKYQNYIMKLKLSDLKDYYQKEMNDYCVKWKIKAHKIYNVLKKQERGMAESLQFYEKQRILECILNAEMKWREKAIAALEENTHLVESFVKLVPPKEHELHLLKRENRKLITRIGQWEKIIPDLIRQMNGFVEVTFENNLAKNLLLTSINKLKEFREIVPKDLAIPVKSRIFEEDDAKPAKNQNAWTIPSAVVPDEDYKTIQLLKIKEKLLESLEIIGHPEYSFHVDEQRKFLKQTILENKRKTWRMTHHMRGVSTRAAVDKKQIIKRMSDIINICDSMFHISGAKNSAPNINEPDNFIEKRVRSINKILD